MHGSLVTRVRGQFVRGDRGSYVSWFRAMRLNIHPNVDGEVAYAAPINGLAVGYIQVCRRQRYRSSKAAIGWRGAVAVVWAAAMHGSP